MFLRFQWIPNSCKQCQSRRDFSCLSCLWHEHARESPSLSFQSGTEEQEEEKKQRGHLEECFLEVNGPIKMSIQVTNSSQSGRREPPAPPSFCQRPQFTESPRAVSPPTAKRSHLAETSGDEWSRWRRDERGSGGWSGRRASTWRRVEEKREERRGEESRVWPLLFLTRPDGCRPLFAIRLGKPRSRRRSWPQRHACTLLNE